MGYFVKVAPGLAGPDPDRMGLALAGFAPQAPARVVADDAGAGNGLAWGGVGALLSASLPGLGAETSMAPPLGRCSSSWLYT